MLSNNITISAVNAKYLCCGLNNHICLLVFGTTKKERGIFFKGTETKDIGFAINRLVQRV
jgi:hypothetical protein